MKEAITNIELNHRRGMGGKPYALSWELGDFRYHVWFNAEGHHSEYIFKNPIDRKADDHRTMRLMSDNKINQKRIEAALAKIGDWKEAIQAAEEASQRREEDRVAEERRVELERARKALSVALEPWPLLAEKFEEMGDDQIIEFSRQLRRHL